MINKDIIKFVKNLSQSFLGRIWLKNSNLKLRIISILGFLEGYFSFGDFFKLFLYCQKAPNLIKFRLYREKKVFDLLQKHNILNNNNSVIFFGKSFYFLNPFEMISQIYSSVINDQYQLRKFLKEDSIFIDCGANIGVISIYAAQIIKRGKIFSFEPEKNSFKLLFKNTSYYKNVCEVYNYALGERIKEGNFIVFYPGFGGNMLEDSIEFNEKKKILENEKSYFDKVKIITLDSFVKSKKLSRIDVIKLDVEGYELKVLDGAKETIAKFKPVIIIADCFDNNTVLKIIEMVKKICYNYKISKFEKLDKVLIFEPILVDN